MKSVIYQLYVGTVRAGHHQGYRSGLQECICALNVNDTRILDNKETASDEVAHSRGLDVFN